VGAFTDRRTSPPLIPEWSARDSVWRRAAHLYMAANPKSATFSGRFKPSAEEDPVLRRRALDKPTKRGPRLAPVDTNRSLRFARRGTSACEQTGQNDCKADVSRRERRPRAPGLSNV